MKGIEQGFLLLTSHLGDPESKPLTVAQFRKLANIVTAAEKPQEDREMSRKDLIALGYGEEMADRIIKLLSRRDLLEYYVNQAARKHCYPVTRISEHYPKALRNRLGLDATGCLWVKGDCSLLNRPAIALAGSRDLEKENRKFAAEAGRQAALQGYVLISGNARGADKVGQDSCLEAGGKVISIVADELQKCNDDPNVLYISEDGYNMPFSAVRALSRNRLIHTMGSATLIAQSGCGRGGTWSGSVANLRNRWTPLCCFDDGTEAAKQLIQMGATGIQTKDLADYSALIQEDITFF